MFSAVGVRQSHTEEMFLSPTFLYIFMGIQYNIFSEYTCHRFVRGGCRWHLLKYFFQVESLSFCDHKEVLFGVMFNLDFSSFLIIKHRILRHLLD